MKQQPLEEISQFWSSNSEVWNNGHSSVFESNAVNNDVKASWLHASKQSTRTFRFCSLESMHTNWCALFSSTVRPSTVLSVCCISVYLFARKIKRQGGKHSAEPDNLPSAVAWCLRAIATWLGSAGWGKTSLYAEYRETVTKFDYSSRWALLGGCQYSEGRTGVPNVRAGYARQSIFAEK